MRCLLSSFAFPALILYAKSTHSRAQTLAGSGCVVCHVTRAPFVTLICASLCVIDCHAQGLWACRYLKWIAYAFASRDENPRPLFSSQYLHFHFLIPNLHTAARKASSHYVEAPLNKQNIACRLSTTIVGQCGAPPPGDSPRFIGLG